jgi:hypothetical protein
MAKQRKPINTIEEFREAVRAVLAERIGGNEVAGVVVVRPDVQQLFNMCFSMRHANPKAVEVAANSIIDGLASLAARKLPSLPASKGEEG